MIARLALKALLTVLFLGLALAPFLFAGTGAIDIAGRICIFIVLAASYDMLLGYTGIVSFAHTLFFGLGAYGVAIALVRLGPHWGAVLLGAGVGVMMAVVIAAIISLLSLRVRAIFFSMITLAVASVAQVLAAEFRDTTGGEDGLTFAVPDLLNPAFTLVAGTHLTGRVMTYYLIFALSLALFLLMRRIVHSPFGRVLQAIRENEFRAEALGYRTVTYRSLASALSAGIAALAGAMMALALRYNGPEATLSFALMVDILLMVVIGGMGTLYGAAIGAVIITLARSYLRPLMAALAAPFAGLPVLPALFNPDRWLLWLGLLFVLIVYFFPGGIVGKLREWGRRS